MSMALLERIAALAPEKREALRRRNPPSFTQKRLWFLQTAAPEDPSYNIHYALRLVRALEPPPIVHGLERVAARHEILRATFPAFDGQPMMLVNPPAPLALPVIDLGRLAPATRRRELGRLLKKESARPFDLARGPLLRCALIQADVPILSLVLHHIIIDGWSFQILQRELIELIDAHAAGRPPRLPPLALQFGDYARWQQSWLESPTLARELDFWKSCLAGAPMTLALPTDRPRSALQRRGGGLIGSNLPAELAETLHDYARGEGLSPFMITLAAFGAVLSRYTGATDIVVGTPIVNRGRTELEPLIGLFLNTLALRLDLGGRPGFGTFARRARAMATAAYDHQELPFEILVEQLQPERDLDVNPIFQVMITLRVEPLEGGEDKSRARVEPLLIRHDTAKFDLNLAFRESSRGVGFALACEYRSDLFDATTIRRFLRHLVSLLRAGLAWPERPIDTLELLSAGERHQLVAEHNDTDRRAAPPSSVVEMFTVQAAVCPDAVAAVCPGAVAAQSWLSYRELERRSSQLARHLCRRGVRTDDRVGLGVGRSLEMVISVLGILKAGAAYVPLDPSYPEERLAFMLAETRGPVLVTESALAARFPAAGAQVLCLDRDAGELARESAAPFASRALPDALAYVIYTSGSTGRPKGVALSHRVLASLIEWHLEQLLPGVCTLQYASLSFDASFHEIFAAWCSGGSVAIVPEQLRIDAVGLARLLETQRVEKAIFPVVMLQRLAEESESAGDRLRLREVTTTGEQLHVTPAVAEFFRRRPGVVFHNHYGPSETHVVTAWTLSGEPAAWPSHPPIGRPVARTAIRLLDRGFSSVPLGVVGRLYIAGISLARGYLERPRLTAERFLPDPWCAEPGGEGAGGRLYDTGDLARWLCDGALRFLGRGDHQVKIRGHRVELGEIEGLLGAHPGVDEAVVVAREDRPGDRRLVAYVVPSKTAQPTVRVLHDFVAEALPAYMVPASFVMLEALPLGPTGKIHRAALPAPAAAPGTPTCTAPRTPTEELLAGIWCEVLGLEQVGFDDDFFAIGGHSLIAMQVVSRLRSVLGVELEVRELFEKRTLENLAAVLERRWQGERAAPPPLVRVAGETAPLSFAQRRLWFLDQLEPAGSVYNVPAALRLAHGVDVAVLAAVFGEVVRRHETLRTSFPAPFGEPVQRVAPPAPVPLPVIDLERLAEPAKTRETRRRVAAEADRPFDLARGPVLRVSLLRLGRADGVLLVTMHHVASDGWSMGILTREVATLYEAFAAGRPSPLPALAIRYADYATWQQSWLAGEVLAAELDFWRRRLAGAPAVLELPTDRPRPVQPSYRGAARPLRLAEGVARSLAALGRREGTTLFMTLLAGFQSLLFRWSGQPDVSVGTPVAGRNRLELEGLIGFFVNTLVLRARFEDDPTVRALLARVREATLEVYAHQDLPFEKLVEELQPQRSLSHSPLFQVMLVLQSTPVEESAAAGVAARMRLIGAPIRTTKFDLLLTIKETAGGLSGAITWATDLFDATTIARLVRQLERVLAGFAEQPGLRVSELPLLGAAERSQLLWEWNDAPEPPLGDGLLHTPFERQARERPEAVALVFGAGAWSYRELDARASLLARRLAELGAGPERVVGIELERGPELVVAILATLKAGAAYLPLDPAYPEARRRFMAEDAAVALLVSRPGLARPGAVERLAALGPCPGAVRPQNLAYLIYTSGSTGEPKGVAITQASAAALLAWGGQVYSDAELSGVLAATSVCFDLSIFELFLPLSRGGTVILAENVLALPALPAASRVTLLNTVPSAVAELARQGAVPGSVETINLAGEPLTARLADALYGLGSVRKVYDLYGPSETTTYSTAGLRRTGARATIGRPLAGERVYLLDRGLRPVVQGAVGEVCLGGAGLARGYLRRSARTAASFVPDPFGARGGARLYRTGDQARWLADGTLEFLGRRDGQVKLRGFRIELGEIETRLERHPAVREVVAGVARGADGEPVLAAWIVPAAEPAPTAAELRGWLQQSLPDAMAPARFVLLEGLPRTASGKIARTALPEPAPEPATVFAPPSSTVEELLCGIWAGVLGVPRVGAHDSFFDLGGHSLLAIRALARVEQVFGLRLPVRAIFEAPTVAALAARFLASRHGGGGGGAPIPRAERGAPLPLSFAQHRFWFQHQLDPHGSFFNLPKALRLRGGLDPAALAAALSEVVRRHEILRTVFPASDGEPRQVVLAHRRAPLPLVDLGALAPGRRRAQAVRLALGQAAEPFDLARGPLLRCALVRLGADEHWLLTTAHHVATDAWSHELLEREIVLLYRAAVEGRPSPLAELPLQYADFAVWQRREIAGERLAGLLEHWRRRLAGLRATELASDRPRPAVLSRRGAGCRIHLDEARVAALETLARGAGATLFMVFCAGFAVTLAARGGAGEVVLGTNVAGRERIETQGLIGCFINQLVLRIDLGGAPSFRALVERTREVVLEAFAHQDLPFDKLVEALEPQPDRSRTPLFQVKIELRHAPIREPGDPGGAVAPLEIGKAPVRYDLHLVLTRTARGVEGTLLYNLDLFEPATAERLRASLAAVLETAGGVPETPLDELLELARDTERRLAEERRREKTRANRDGLRNLRRQAVGA